MSDTKAGGAWIEVYAKDSLFYRAMNAQLKFLKGWAGRATAIGAGAGLATFGVENGLAALQTLASSFSIVGIAKQFADAGSAIDDMAQRTGFATQELAELEYAGKLTDVTLDDIAKGAKGFSAFLAEAASGSQTAIDMLSGLKLDGGALLSGSQLDRFYMLADAIAGVRDPAIQSAIAAKLFGKSGINLLPMLRMGSDGIKKLTAEARDMGVAMGSEDVAAAAELGDAFDRFGAITSSIGRLIGAAFAAPVSDALEAVQGILVPIGKWINQNRALLRVVVPVVAGTAGLATVLAAVAGAASLLAPLAVPILGLGAALAGVGFVAIGVKRNWGELAKFGKSSFAWLANNLRGLTGNIGANFGSLLSWLLSKFRSVASGAIEYFGAIGTAIAGGNLTAAFNVGMAGLELAWVNTTNAMGKVWNDWKAGILTIWSDAVTWIAGAIVSGISLAEREFGSLFDWLESGWNRVSTAMQRSFNMVFTAGKALLKYGAISLQQKEAFGFDAKSQAKQKQFEKEKQKVLQDAAMSMGQTDTKLAKQQAEREEVIKKRGDERKARTESERNSMLEALKQTNEAYKGQVSAGAAAANGAADDTMAKAQAAYQEALQKAKEAGGLKPADIDKFKPTKFETSASRLKETQTSETSGAFNAMAAAMGSTTNYSQAMADRLGDIFDVLKIIETKNVGLT